MFIQHLTLLKALAANMTDLSYSFPTTATLSQSSSSEESWQSGWSLQRFSYSICIFVYLIIQQVILHDKKTSRLETTKVIYSFNIPNKLILIDISHTNEGLTSFYTASIITVEVCISAQTENAENCNSLSYGKC